MASDEHIDNRLAALRTALAAVRMDRVRTMRRGRKRTDDAKRDGDRQACRGRHDQRDDE